MGALDALYTAVRARYSSDTGAGGLAQSGGAARIVDFVRDGDAKDSTAMPYAEVSITPMRAMEGRADSMQIVQVQFILHVERQQSFTKQNALVDRIRTRYNDHTMTAVGGYSFSPMVWSGSEQGDGDQRRVPVETYEVVVFETGDSRLLGQQAAFSGITGTFFEWSIRQGVRKADITTPIDHFEKHETGREFADFRAKLYVTGLPPARGAYSGCVFTIKSGVTVTADVTVEDVRTLARLGQNQLQLCELQGSLNGEWTEASS